MAKHGILDSDFDELLFYFSLLYNVMSITSVVTFILWFRRAYYNLHTQTDGLRYKEYFAALWWFIPFLNLYKPKHIMNELYSQTEDVIHEKDPGYIPNLSFNFVNLWWMLWVVSDIAGYLDMYRYYSAETVEKIANALKHGMILSAISIPLAILTIIIIKQYATVESKLLEVSEQEIQSDDKQNLLSGSI